LIRSKGYITDNERDYLVNIVEKETGFHQLYGVMKKISYIIFDFFKNHSDIIISIGETKNPVKINLYRNIIKNSFENIESEKVKNVYKKLCLKYHPDKGGNTEAMQAINDFRRMLNEQ
jgi:predicted choloylglycine hydrolase